MKYAVIVTYVNGRHRGFTAVAESSGRAIQKVLETLTKRESTGDVGHEAGIVSVACSEILLDEDEMD